MLNVCRFLLLPLVVIGFATSATRANEVDVVDVTIESMGDQRYRINVTLLHEDDGWDHYANRWDVLDESGELLGSRVLAHPHDNEQPFTRSLTLSIPDSVKTVTIRANDSVHETGGAEMSIDPPK